VILLSASAVAAEESPSWALSAGVYDTAGHPGDRQPAELGIELRLRPWTSWKLIPAFGISATKDENYWVYGGLRWDWEVGTNWVVTPQFAISVYERGNGPGKELGGAIEFRSGLEGAYRFENGQRLGLLFYHLSNSSIYELNPGSNSLVLTWSFGG
jgi:lipid A 3-O-deacylase